MGLLGTTGDLYETLNLAYRETDPNVSMDMEKHGRIVLYIQTKIGKKAYASYSRRSLWNDKLGPR